MNILQAIADFATVTNVKRSTQKLLFIQKKNYFSQFLLIQHPHLAAPMFRRVDAAGLCVQVGSQHISWHTTHHCMGEVLCQSGLSLPEVSSSYSCLCLTQEKNLLLRGSLHINVFVLCHYLLLLNGKHLPLLHTWNVPTLYDLLLPKWH